MLNFKYVPRTIVFFLTKIYKCFKLDVNLPKEKKQCLATEEFSTLSPNSAKQPDFWCIVAPSASGCFLLTKPAQFCSVSVVLPTLTSLPSLISPSLNWHISVKQCIYYIIRLTYNCIISI